MADEEVLAKSGMELYKELLRIYPVADVEDYYKAGVWRDELIRTDIMLVEAHRKEAGAPDPIPLEEVKEPVLPKSFGIGLGGVRPMLPGTGVRPGGMVTTPGTVIGVRPTLTTPAATTGAAAGGPMAEQRLMALFTAKHKMDPTKTKTMLTKLETPARRRHIIQTFVPKAGQDPTASLEQYIAQCEANNSWGTAAATTGTTTTTAVKPVTLGATPVRPVLAKPFSAAAPTLGAGVKRPIAPMSLLDPSKRPRITLPAGMVSPAGVRPAGAGVVRPAGAFGGAIRPAQPKAKAGEKPGELIRNLLQRF